MLQVAGSGTAAPEGALDRARMRALVFADPQAKRALEVAADLILGGAVRTDVEELVAQVAPQHGDQRVEPQRRCERDARAMQERLGGVGVRLHVVGAHGERLLRMVHPDL